MSVILFQFALSEMAMSEDTMDLLFGAGAYVPFGRAATDARDAPDAPDAPDTTDRVDSRDLLVVLVNGVDGADGQTLIEALPVMNGANCNGLTRADTGVWLPADAAHGTVLGRPAYVLTAATQRLRAYRGSQDEVRDAALPVAAQRARLLECVYGATHLLTSAVAAKMKPGEYVVQIGSETAPCVARFDPAKMELNGKALSGTLKYDRYDVFVLRDVTARM